MVISVGKIKYYILCKILYSSIDSIISKYIHLHTLSSNFG